jgi:maleylpyruvate isomerase
VIDMTTVPGTDTLERLIASTTALVRTVDGLDDDALRAPSTLPGWSRGHVVAHLALNGEGLAAVLDGLAHDEPGSELASVPMYASDEARDRDIDELAGASATELRERLLAACTAFADAVPRVPTDAWSRKVPRTPGGATFRAAEIVSMRQREVEIHHVDLDAGYAHGDWPAPFVVDLLDTVSHDRADDGPFTLHATDLDRRWPVGAGDGAEVAGTGADLGWWLTGRGQAGGLTVDGGALPQLGPWRRRPATGR